MAIVKTVIQQFEASHKSDTELSYIHVTLVFDGSSSLLHSCKWPGHHKLASAGSANLPYTLYIVDIKKESFMNCDIIFNPKSGHSNIAQILTTLSPV